MILAMILFVFALRLVNAKELILINTVSGRFYCVDKQTGTIEWDSAGKNMELELFDRDERFLSTFIIEPVGQGHVYSFDENKLVKWRHSIAELVFQSPFKSTDGEYILGEKKVFVLVIDPETGETIYSPIQDNVCLKQEGEKKILLYRTGTWNLLSRLTQDYVLYVYKAKSNSAKLRITLSQYSGVKTNLLNDPFLHFYVSWNRLRVFEKGNLLWKLKFDSPISSVFFVDSNLQVQQIDLSMKNKLLPGGTSKVAVDVHESGLLYLLPAEGEYEHEDNRQLIVYDRPEVDVIETVRLIDAATKETWNSWSLLYPVAFLIFALITAVYAFNKTRPKGESKSSKLKLTDSVLGYGSHGTVVYKGTFDKREVAVKRLLVDFFNTSEVSLLLHIDDHPNIIRYFYQEQIDTFIYIAFELCIGTLEEFVNRPEDFPLAISRDTVISEVLNGLFYLHSLNIIHRDIKPQNVLINQKNRIVLSDFGLSKKMEYDQSSVNHSQFSGSLGWTAPEVLNENKITKQMDIFSCGCLYYFILSKGCHPFGDNMTRDTNIRIGNFLFFNKKPLSHLQRDLIERMLVLDPSKRISSQAALLHPVFWSAFQKLTFIQDISDAIDILPKSNPVIDQIESYSMAVFKLDWISRLDPRLLSDASKFRSYDAKSFRDLLRLIRNKVSTFMSF